MTKEKAIEILKYIKHVGNGESEYVGCAQEIALDMAIKSLEQKHPVVTNRDKMIETFGGAYFNLIINYISDRSLEDYDIWLHEEYKEPKGENKYEKN